MGGGAGGGGFWGVWVNRVPAETADSLAWPCQSVFWRLRRWASSRVVMESMWLATRGLRPPRPEVAISTEPSPAGTWGRGIGAPVTETRIGPPPRGRAMAVAEGRTPS